jgi:hypothetical protein
MAKNIRLPAKPKSEANARSNVLLGAKSKHSGYNIYSDKWRRCRDVVAGQDAIYAACEATNRYLPKLVDETLEDYNARLQRTPFYNATWRTIAGFVGMLFRKPPTLEVPKKVEILLKDVTMSGMSFEALAKEAAYEDLTVSRLGIFVDHPKQKFKADGSTLSVAEAEKLGQRPTMRLYKAEAIIDWKYEYINNVYTLTQVRLTEEEAVAKNEFETEYKPRIKILDLINGQYRIRICDGENEEQIGDDLYPLMDGKNLDYIPFYFVGPDSTEATLDEPILIDLVDLNLKHFGVSSDYEHGCHFAGLPTAVVSGYTEPVNMDTGKVEVTKFYIGSPTAWVFSDPNAKAEFLEFKGQGLGSLEKNLDRKEAGMAAIGARMLAPEKSGVEAANTLAMRHSGEHSILAAIAIAVSEGMTKALTTFCKWAGHQGEVKFDINRDFIPIIADPSLMTQLMAAVQAGELDGESFFDWLKRADLVDPKLTYEDMQARIDANPPAPPIAPLGHNGGPTLEEDDTKPPKAPPADPAPKAE